VIMLSNRNGFSGARAPVPWALQEPGLYRSETRYDSRPANIGKIASMTAIAIDMALRISIAGRGTGYEFVGLHKQPTKLYDRRNDD